MLSDDDHDSIFGGDSQNDHEQAGLALPSLHSKTMAAAAANGECGGSRAWSEGSSPPTGASVDDAIPILDDDAEPQRPKKRRRKAAHPSPSLNSSPVDAIQAVMQSLTTDLSVTSLLQALLEHLKPFSDPTTTKIRRVDINGREIFEEEWRFLKTQDFGPQVVSGAEESLESRWQRQIECQFVSSPQGIVDML
ncbi:hypothetical protein FRC05_008849 [Tulasnella sp. 425]|nr:hypothetical protein FRC05_008849 [Tulasnella sp. 425]